MIDTEANVRAHIEALATTIGERHVLRPQALAAAAEYIADTWQRQGHAVDRQDYEAAGQRCANLVVTVPGSRPAAGILLFGAHYDTIPDCPGANDNGSGVAALLEIAGQLAGTRPAMTVRLVAFVNEEPPFFGTAQQGSAVYARAARARGDDIRLMIALETMGCYSDRPGSQRYPPLLRHFYPDRGDFLALIGDLRSLPAVRRLARAFRAHADLPLEYAGLFRWIPGVGWSDHLPFWRLGYRAVMATDTAFHRYRYYHTPQDTPDKLNFTGLARATQGLSAAAAALGGDGRDL